MGMGKRAEIEFSLSYQSFCGQHVDRYYVGNVDFWRDVFPGDMAESLEGLAPGDVYTEQFKPGVLIPPYRQKSIHVLPKSEFTSLKNGSSMVESLLPGRYYPKGYGWKNLNTFSVDATPVRIIEDANNTFTIDTNHPLAEKTLTLQATGKSRPKMVTQRGGAVNDLAALLVDNGPGMQVPIGALVSHAYDEYPFRRDDSGNDEMYYKKPRLVHHLDSTARMHVRDKYSKLVPSGSRVLDFMSSWESHMSDSLSDCRVEGLGMNKEELSRNERLSAFTVQDLNKTVDLPYGDNTFDSVICTVSIEYLCYPREIMAELARIIVPGGKLVITVSDRWFPGKEILPWAELHPFERQGLVLQYFLNQKDFTDLGTESIRGYPRPPEDRYSAQMIMSDSLYFVWGTKVQ